MILPLRSLLSLPVRASLRYEHCCVRSMLGAQKSPIMLAGQLPEKPHHTLIPASAAPPMAGQITTLPALERSPTPLIPQEPFDRDCVQLRHLSRLRATKSVKSLASP